MKKLLIITALLTISGTAQAGSWDTISAWGKKEVKSAAYTVDTSGNNLRAYTWEDPVTKCALTAVISRKNLSVSQACPIKGAYK